MVIPSPRVQEMSEGSPCSLNVDVPGQWGGLGLRVLMCSWMRGAVSCAGRDTLVDMGRAPAHTLLLWMVLGCSAAFTDILLPGPEEPVVNVAVVFGGSSYPLHIRSRLSPQSFLDMPLEIHPITVVVNNTNPSTLLTQICDILASHKIHGIVFEDNVGTEAVAQILDFISSQTQVPIISISGGSAVVLTPKVRCSLGISRGDERNEELLEQGREGIWNAGGQRNCWAAAFGIRGRSGGSVSVAVWLTGGWDMVGTSRRGPINGIWERTSTPVKGLPRCAASCVHHGMLGWWHWGSGRVITTSAGAGSNPGMARWAA